MMINRPTCAPPPFSLGVGPILLSEPPSESSRFSLGALYLSAVFPATPALPKLRSLGLSYINGAAPLPRTQQLVRVPSIVQHISFCSHVCQGPAVWPVRSASSSG